MVRWISGEGAGRMIFVDDGGSGYGVPRYTRAPAYATMGNAVPKVVGARHICGKCEVHNVGEDGGPVATSDAPAEVSFNMFEGGSKAAYRKAVEEHDLKEHKIKPVKPRVVA